MSADFCHAVRLAVDAKSVLCAGLVSEEPRGSI
jgi:hypothetical protein